MMYMPILFVALIVLMFVFQREMRTAVRSAFSNLETIEVDKCGYKVLPDYDNKKGAAEILHRVDKNITTLITYMQEKYTPLVLETMEPKKKRLYEQIVRRMETTYKPSSLEETVPDTPKVDVSYNISKGEVLALCLRDYKTHEFHQDNEIIFVTLHELAHSLNCDESSYQCGQESYGHTALFWFIFKVLLENAVECGIYSKRNYRSKSVNYCSMPITYSPLYDVSLKDSEFFSNR